MARNVGIVFDKTSGTIKRVIVPTHDRELSDPSMAGADEALDIVDRRHLSCWPNFPPRLFSLIEEAAE